MIDSDAYFSRIGFTEIPKADLKTLQTIQRLHTQVIPFENLDPLLGLPAKLVIELLQQKMVWMGTRHTI